MGKDKKSKKKGAGMEKTLAKTEKKIDKAIKKELEEIGEESIEKLIADSIAKEQALNKVKEDTLDVGQSPSRRGGSTFNLFPEKDELILFGGEYYNGNKVAMYNDLFIYSIKKNQWTRIRAPNGPAPRTFHQSAFVSRNGGELWVFGGEFSSPSQSQFYHYNDLWCFQFQSKTWKKIAASNGPSARSGHRMVVMKKYLVVFGGYYDNLRNCRFYNDTYLFNLETERWEEMSWKSNGLVECPSVRSACQLSVCGKNNTIVLYGGFSKEMLKKGREKAIVHSDMFVLHHEARKTGQMEWFWKKAKQGGVKPSERLSYSMITISDETALLFGGVHDLKDDEDMNDDDDDEEGASSIFYNDLYKLDLTTQKWSPLHLRGKKEVKTKSKKVEAKEAGSDNTNDQEMLDESKASEESLAEEVEELTIEDIEKLTAPVKQNEEDDVFKLQISAPVQQSELETQVIQNQPPPMNVFLPHPRRSMFLQYHKSVLYMYGGKFEDRDDKEITLNDLYSLNLKRCDEWTCINEDKEFKLDQLAKSMESSDDSEDDDDDDDEMEIDAPKAEEGETIEDYFTRTNELWLSEASTEFPDEKSKKFLKKMAFEICSMFWDSVKPSA